MSEDVKVSATALNNAAVSLNNAAEAIGSELPKIKQQQSDLDQQAQDMLEQQKNWEDNVESKFKENLPFYRVTKNVTLKPNADSSKPVDWGTGTNPDYKLLYTVQNNVPWEDRTADEQELLTAMGHKGARYITTAFNVWEATLHKEKENASNYGLLAFFSAAVVMTEMCMSKRVSGDYKGYGMTLGLKDDWSLTGRNFGRGGMGYNISHLCASTDSRMTTETSVIRFALPQLVAGKYPLDSTAELGIIPFLGEGAGHYE